MLRFDFIASDRMIFNAKGEDHRVGSTHDEYHRVDAATADEAINIHPIRNAQDHERALRELSAYFEHEPEPGTAIVSRC
ncbi:MAG TPA: hypothetical protein VGN24_10030 [Rhodanobacter sp.]|nr:hypothetical protein [Rhodanobacter sp.]